MTEQERGVPREEATAKDFMQVRAALVKRVGGANEALVWTRIDWRADSARVAHRSDDGTLWWAATHQEIAAETGLTAEQVRRAIEKLVARGFLQEDSHHGFDRRKSYAPIFAHPADSPNGEIAASIRRDSQIEAAKSPNAPLIETGDVEDILSTDESADGNLIPDGWRPNQGHIDKAASLHLDVKREYQRFRDHAERTRRRLKNWNTGFTNWLRKQAEFAQQRQGRAPVSSVPTPADRALETMALGRRLQQMDDAQQVGELTA